MSFDAILFDLDGTLIDSRRDIARSVNHALTALGRPEQAVEVLATYIGDGVRVLMERAFATSDAAVIEPAIALWRPHYLEHCLDATRLYDGIADLLDALRDTPLGVVSNKPVAPSEVILAGLGIRARFAVVVGGDSCSARKPDPAPLLFAVGRMGACGGRVLMVGDSANDVEAARRAGYASCGVLWGIGGEEEVRGARPDCLAWTPAEVVRVAGGGA